MPIKQELLDEALKEDDAARSVNSIVRVQSSEPAVGSGANFTSSIDRVLVDVVLGSGKETTKSLIVKEMPTKGRIVKYLESEAFFKTEIRLYKEVLPQLEDALREQRVPPLWPRFLGMKGDYLIFSDLKEKNYEMKCRVTRLDLEHALLTVRALAPFHAASVVLKQRGKLDTTGYQPPFLLRRTSPIRRLRKGAAQTLARTVIENWGSEWSQIGERLQDLSNRTDDVEKLGEIDENRLNVICHGDLWVTNIMFKYSKVLDLPIGVRFVDYQLASYNSYGYDLLFFIGTSLPTDIRRNSKLEIIHSYWSVLSETLEFYGYPHLAPSMNDILKELERLELLNMMILIGILPITATDVENSFDMEKISTEGELSAHNPKVFLGQFKNEVDQELLKWAEDGLL